MLRVSIICLFLRLHVCFVRAYERACPKYMTLYKV